MTNMTLGWYS